MNRSHRFQPVTRLWWRAILLGFVISTLIALITWTFKPVDAVVRPMLLGGIVVLHPIMNKPVRLFEPGWLCRRFYIGVALVSVATIILGVWY